MSCVNSPVSNCPLAKPSLTFMVQREDGKNISAPISITVTGPGGVQTKPTDSGTASAQVVFSELEPGTYTLTDVKLAGQEVKARIVCSDQLEQAGRQLTLEQGAHPGFLLLLLLTRVTPFLDLEHDAKTLPYDPRPLDQRPPGAAADRVQRVTLRYEQDRPVPRYTGGATFQLKPELADVFTDSALTQPLALNAGQATIRFGGQRLELFLRGKGAGDMELSLTLEVPAEAGFELAPAVKKQLTVKEQIIVTPKLEAEYKVVLFDGGLAAHQDGTDAKKFVPDPTYVLLSLKPSKSSPKFDKGTKLIVDPPHVEVFSDQKCQTKLDLSQAIPADKLTGKTPLKVWLKAVAKKKGKFKLTLAPAGTLDPQFKLDPAAELELGVVEVRLELHGPDQTALAALRVDPNVDPIATYHTALKDLALPPQKLMTEAEQVKPGRLLHVQDGTVKDRFGRARLVLKQLDATQWPDGCDEYEIVLNETNTSGAVELYDKETEPATAKAFPFKVKVSALKTAAQELWVQGKSVTKAWRDVRLDLGLDRAKAAPDKEEKRNGDWLRCTVVQIEKVEVDYQAPAQHASAWDKTQQRFYINLQAGATGREVELGAKLSKALAGVTIHFMLAPHRDNRKVANWGIDLPAGAGADGGVTKPRDWPWHEITWDLKQKDKADPKHLLHLSEVTDAKGYAKCKLTLSRFAGDIFLLGAYLAEDPHLAKFVDGHAELEVRKPVGVNHRIQVWRKFWYQMSFPKGCNPEPPEPDTAVTAYEEVRAEMVFDRKTQFKKADVPARTFYKKYIIAGGDSTDEVANIGDYNKGAIATLTRKDQTDQPVKFNLLICLYQYDSRTTNPITKVREYAEETGSSAALTAKPAVDSDVKITLPAAVFDPPLQGGSMIAELYWFRQSDAATKHNIPANKASIPRPRTNNREIVVKAPDIDPPPTALDPVTIVATCKVPDGPYLGEGGKNPLIVYDSNDVADYNDTVVHEIGHVFGQTPDPATQPDPTHLPDHWKAVNANNQGTHCRVQNPNNTWRCVMYDSGPNPDNIHKYCETCHPYLLVWDLYVP